MIYGDRYKKTDKRYIEWQRATTNDDWQRMVQEIIAGGTASDEWQRITTSDSEWYNEWQKMTMSDSEWQKVVQRVKAAHVLKKNGLLQFFLQRK